MELKKSGIVIWCGDAPNQRALACKIAATHKVLGIVIDVHKTSKKKRTVGAIFLALIDRVRFRKIYEAWKQLMRFYNEKFPEWPDIPVVRVASINDQQTAIFTKACNPALIIVSGTGLIKEPLISLPVNIGIVNLHTGLSPYVKGGPNCTNWCIANNEWHLVGNTIMWLNSGIDAGNLITTESLDIRKSPSLAAAHRAVMEHAHDLYIRAIEYLLNTTTAYQSVSQKSLATGNLFLSRMWTSNKKKILLKNWKKKDVVEMNSHPITVALPK